MASDFFINSIQTSEVIPFVNTQFYSHFRSDSVCKHSVYTGVRTYKTIAPLRQGREKHDSAEADSVTRTKPTHHQVWIL